MPQSDDPILSLAAQIVSAHIEHNDTRSRALPGLIRDVYRALASVEGRTESPEKPRAAEARVRQAPPGETVFDDHLICLECGLHMKMLKRHLQTVHNVTPSRYRAKWQLPGDYPMVARHYARLRSDLAKESGLGKRPAVRRG